MKELAFRVPKILGWWFNKIPRKHRSTNLYCFYFSEKGYFSATDLNYNLPKRNGYYSSFPWYWATFGSLVELIKYQMFKKEIKWTEISKIPLSRKK